MSGHSPGEQAIFEEARKIESLEEQARYAARMCGDDAQMLIRIRNRLQADESNQLQDLDDWTLDSPPVDKLDATRDSDFTVPQTTKPSFLLPPGTVIAGRYKLLEMIAEGGMGSVWVARQSEPVKRRVALKLIKPGMDSRQVLARFDAERQALALMEHPNIAQVYDGGLTRWFVE